MRMAAATVRHRSAAWELCATAGVLQRLGEASCGGTGIDASNFQFRLRMNLHMGSQSRRLQSMDSFVSSE
jgi:hypothetical protein